MVLYYDVLSITDANRIPKKLWGLTLQTQLYDRPFDLRRSIPNKVIASDRGMNAIVEAAFYKRDPHSVVAALSDY